MKPPSVLILCTGNSARSVLGEYLLRHLSEGKVVTASAGSEPTGHVHPLALDVLAKDYGIDASGATSKGLDVVADGDFDLVLTVCDQARDRCPIWLAKGRKAHWGLPDPASIVGDRATQRRAFERTAAILSERFQRWLELDPEDRLDPDWLDAIAALPAASTAEGSAAASDES
jgi:arsenate reductase